MDVNENKSKKIAIAVITYYPSWYQGKLRSIKQTDKIRGDLAIDFFKKTTQLSYHLIVADGKSSKSFLKTISLISNIIIVKKRSSKRSVRKREIIKKASKLPGVKVIIITEPEKISIINNIPLLAESILNGQMDIVIPKRELNLFKQTYPEYQYQSEVEGNKLYNEILRTNGLFKNNEDLDLFFGPRVFLNEIKIVSLFTKKFNLKINKRAYLDSYFDIEDYSANQFFAIVLALKKKLRIKSVQIPFSYPKIQKDNEEKGSRKAFEEKRKFQKISLLIELLYFLSSFRKMKI